VKINGDQWTLSEKSGTGDDQIVDADLDGDSQDTATRISYAGNSNYDIALEG
jgi:hypothetical protein